MTLSPRELRERTTLSVEETAEALGGGRTGTYEAVRKGDIPSIKHGRKLRIPASYVLRTLGLDEGA